MVFYGEEDWTMVKIETIGRSRMMATQDRERGRETSEPDPPVTR